MRLGRSLLALMPAEVEVHGLVALMELHASRLDARVGQAGKAVLLLDQDRSRWDWSLVRRGLARLDRAMILPPTPGPYGLQAMIAACHAHATCADDTDWIAIAAYYQALALLTPSPVIEINRAVAVGMAFGSAQGLAILDTVKDDPHLQNSHLLPTVRGDLLEKMGQFIQAREEFDRAAKLTMNATERALLIARAKVASSVID